MKKTELRNFFAEKRKVISTKEYEMLNKALLLQFKSLDFSSVNTLHTFLPAEGKHEVNTAILIDYLKADYPPIRIAVPKSDFSTHTLTHYLHDESLVLKKNKYGIYEPEEGNEIHVLEIDRVLVPLLCFDRRGYRVGYGKGFYDRFLKECRPNVESIGLSLFDPVEEIEDVNEYDVQLKSCITPGAIFNFDML